MHSLVTQMLGLMVELEEDPEWAMGDDVDDDDADSNAVAGESALDRFACGIGGRTMLPQIKVTIPPMLQNRKNIEEFFYIFLFRKVYELELLLKTQGAY